MRLKGCFGINETTLFWRELLREDILYEKDKNYLYNGTCYRQ